MESKETQAECTENCWIDFAVATPVGRGTVSYKDYIFCSPSDWLCINSSTKTIKYFGVASSLSSLYVCMYIHMTIACSDI